MSNYQETPTVNDECPVCIEPYQETIRIVTPATCVHSICSSCFLRCSSCPTCRVSYELPLLPPCPARATRSEPVGQGQPTQGQILKRHIAALIEMLRQFVRCMQRSEIANGTGMHEQYMNIGRTMVQTIVEQEFILQTQYIALEEPLSLNLYHRRRYHYQGPHFNLLNLQESLLERLLISESSLELPPDHYPLSLRLTRSRSNTNHAREVLARLQEEMVQIEQEQEDELPVVILST